MATATNVKVEFRNVGRGKRTWTATLPDLSDVSLLREIRKNGGLASRGVEVEMEEDGTGAIFVGGWRMVGTFEVVGAR